MILGSVYYRVSDPGTLVVVGLHYTQPGPDAFFWAGERRVNGGCNDDNIASDSYSLHPGQVGSKLWQISDKDDILIKEHNQFRTCILDNDYYDVAKPVLPAYDGSQKDIILRLPYGVTVR